MTSGTALHWGKTSDTNSVHACTHVIIILVGQLSGTPTLTASLVWPDNFSVFICGGKNSSNLCI